jgi:hypothetical protein
VQIGQPPSPQYLELVPSCLIADETGGAEIMSPIAFSTRCASSAICPASSTPVGPAPTIANVIHASRSTGSDPCSASSNAPRIRLRSRFASSSVFIPGASWAHSSWPK